MNRPHTILFFVFACGLYITLFEYFQIGGNSVRLVTQKSEREKQSSWNDNKFVRHSVFSARVKRQFDKTQDEESFFQDAQEIMKSNRQIKRTSLSPTKSFSDYESLKSTNSFKNDWPAFVRPSTFITDGVYSVPVFPLFSPYYQQKEQEHVFETAASVRLNEASGNQEIIKIPFQNLPKGQPLFCIFIPTLAKYKHALVPNSDKTELNRKSSFANPAKPVFECPENFTRCMDGTKCISKSAWCDSYIDCPDASDEIKCNCLDRIRKSKICDNYHDCPNGEDELGCFGCSKDKYSCNDRINSSNNVSKCIDPQERCDGKKHCDNGIDERGCVILKQNLTNLNEMFPVGLDSGFIHVRRDKWYIACGYTYDWAEEACKAELGSLSSAPKVRLLPNSNLSSQGFYITQDGTIKTTCPSFLHVECPSPIVGSKMIGSSETMDDPIVSIVGGRDSQPLAWPFVVEINRNGNFHCGGVILNDLWILSAAHCFKDYKNSYYEVDAGSLRRLSYASTLQTRRVANLVIHRDFDPLLFLKDIALMLLDQRLNFNSWVRPVRLPEQPYGRQDVPALGTRCTVVGWGSTREGGPDPDNLREVEVPIIPCKYVQDLNAATICAGYASGGRDSCQGDSGGPLMCRLPNSNSKWYIGGIVSHGLGCARINEPGTYTKVAYFVPWINSIMNGPKSPELMLQPLPKCPGFSCSLFKRCLPANKRCDLRADCIGAEDEIGCTSN